MLSRRSFFAAAAGALAGAAGVAAAAPVPTITGFDLAAGPDMTVWAFSPPKDWSSVNTVIEVLGGGPYAQPNDLTREQYAANLPVIGRDALPADKPRRAPKVCAIGAPAKETQEQYRRRVGTKCPGMLE